MNRKILVVLVVLMLLSGCGQRRQPDVEHFQGEIVATLQKPINPESPEPLDTDLPPSEDAELTPLASETLPSGNPEGPPTPTPPSRQSTGYPATAGTTTLIPEPSATVNLTKSPTPTLGTAVWQGVWKVWYQTVSGGYTPSELTIEVSDTRLIGTAKIDGVDYTFKGDIYTQGTQVQGEWQTASNTGTFWWRMSSPDTFVGSRENRFGLCGNRAAAIQPNPCREIPQN